MDGRKISWPAVERGPQERDGDRAACLKSTRGAKTGCRSFTAISQLRQSCAQVPCLKPRQMKMGSCRSSAYGLSGVRPRIRHWSRFSPESSWSSSDDHAIAGVSARSQTTSLMSAQRGRQAVLGPRNQWRRLSESWQRCRNSLRSAAGIRFQAPRPPVTISFHPN